MNKWLDKFPDGGSILYFLNIPKIEFPNSRGESTQIKQPINLDLPTLERQKEIKKFNRAKQSEGNLKEISKEDYNKSKKTSIKEVLLNPVTAIKRTIHGQDLNQGFSNDRNIYDSAVDIINPSTYIKAAYNTGANILHPFKTATTLGKAGLNTLSNISDGKNIFNDGSNEQSLNILGDAALTLGIKGGIKDGFQIADKQFSKVGQQLERIKFEGENLGLDAHSIAKNQMEQVGITSNQRQAYNPIISNFAEKYITPYGYEGFGNQSKLQQTWDNIKKGGVDFGKNDKGILSRQHITNERGDAWKLYLGKPQTKGTFKLSETAPVNHPSYSPKTLKGMDIYNLDAAGATLGIEPSYMSPSLLNPRSLENNMNLLRNKINIDRGNEVMGGYNKSLSKDGLQYNDIWDLNPQITPSRYVPKKLVNALDENPLLYKKTDNYGYSPRSFKFPVDKLLGKPFMSHGNLPYTSTDLVNNMKNVISSSIENDVKSTIDMTPRISKYKQYLEELKQYPKYNDGGKLPNNWLNKY